MSRYLLVSPDVAFERRIAAALNVGDHAELTRIESVDDVEDHLKTSRSPIDVVALGPGLELDEALAAAGRLDIEHPELSVLLVAEPSPTLWEHALRAGVRDVAHLDAEDAELADLFERTAHKVIQRRAHLAGDAAHDPAAGSRIITVVSPKGGAGKTTVATNLAAALAAGYPGRVVIVDADLQFGDVAGAMHLMPENSIADAARLNGSLDAMTLKVFLAHHPAELYALCAPESPADGEMVAGDSVGRIVKLLASEFDYVIVDTSSGLSEATLSALEVSTDVVTVCSMDVPSVRGMRKLLTVLQQLGMTAHRRHYLLNRADAKVGLETADVEASLEVTLDVVIPSTRAIPLALNQGLPVIHSDPRSPASRQLRSLAERFAPSTTTAQTGSTKLFSRRGAR